MTRDQIQLKHRKIIGYWLLLLCVMVYSMVLIGGMTRLTQSGLSMVEWKPLTGWLPPLNDLAWQEMFRKYQSSPEYRKLNTGMTVTEFKSIFWLEYIHRIWGRLIGVVVIIPLVVFAAKRWLDRPLLLRLIGLFILGGLQGVMGWYMVKSGLIDHPDVSPYRLTAHLGLALLIFGLLIWTLLDVLAPNVTQPVPSHLCRWVWGICLLVILTILSGGFVAGNNAGLTYNTFPLMDGDWIPPGLFDLSPVYRNFFENIATVQFNHRVLAVTTVFAVIVFWISVIRQLNFPRLRLLLHGLLVIVCIQASLGISTLLLAVPVNLAIAHQAVAFAVFAVAVWLAHDLQTAPQQHQV